MESSTSAGLLVDLAQLEQAPNLDLTKFVYVVLSDPGELESDVARKVRSYVEKGGALLISTGINTVRGGSVPVTGEKLSMGNAAQSAGEVDTQHPALAETGRFENVRFIDSVRVQPNGRQKFREICGRCAFAFRRTDRRGKGTDLRRDARQFNKRFSAARFVRSVCRAIGFIFGGRERRSVEHCGGLAGNLAACEK